jgi:tocopherol O-methyltransferase
VKKSTPERVARYYADLAGEYSAYGGAAQSWNYGVWEPDVRTHQAALQRGKELLVRGLDIGPDTRLLDVGFGSGGFAVWCASQFGCRVTGITICEENIDLAENAALEAGVSERCEFRLMDMEALVFEPESFDVVTNQETLCYAHEKRRYLRSVFRVLSPGGVWSSIDCNLRPGKLSAGESEALDSVLQGFHIPQLISAEKTKAHCLAAGFVDFDMRDLTELSFPTASLIMRRSHGALKLARRFPRRRLHSPDAREEANVRGHYEAGMAYAVGLHTGLFQQVWYRARKPPRI